MLKTVSRNAKKSFMAVFLRRQQPLLVKIKIALERAFRWLQNGTQHDFVGSFV